MHENRRETLQDLGDTYSEALFGQFQDLYCRTFEPSDLREDPADIAERLKSGENGTPITNLIVATVGERVVGAVVFERYVRSRCGLITYLMVDPAYRGQGIARRLKASACEKLTHKDKGLRAIFAETEKPLDADDETPRRLQAMSSLGFMYVPVHYIQPRLSDLQSRSASLWLLISPLDRGQKGRIGVDILRDFLEEFYSVLEGGTDESCLEDILSGAGYETFVRVQPVPLVAIPVLDMCDASICLHYVEPDVEMSEADVMDIVRSRKIFGSFESDLIAHRYHRHKKSSMPPFFSKCVTNPAEEFALRLPEKLSYESENREQILIFRKNDKRVQICVSFTQFRRARLRVWHLSVRPARNERFSEFDILRLASMFDRQIENVRFLGKGGEPVPREGAIELLDAEGNRRTFPAMLGADDRRAGKAAQLAGVTIEAIPAPRDGWSRIGFPRQNDPGASAAFLAQLYKQLATARSGDAEARAALAKRLDNRSSGGFLRALAGLVSGIYDFPRFDLSELLDVLNPTIGDVGFIHIHRELMVEFKEDPGVTEAVIDSLGISPYLVIPQGVLLAQEYLVEKADEWLMIGEEEFRQSQKKVFLSKMSRRLVRKLESTIAKVDEKLNAERIPNVFNYATERRLYDTGLEDRGISDWIFEVGLRLTVLQQKAARLRRGARSRSETAFNWLLGVISVVEAKDVLWSALDDLGHQSWRWPAFAVLALLVAGVLGFFEFRSAGVD